MSISLNELEIDSKILRDVTAKLVLDVKLSTWQKMVASAWLDDLELIKLWEESQLLWETRLYEYCSATKQKAQLCCEVREQLSTVRGRVRDAYRPTICITEFVSYSLLRLCISCVCA
jgi:hypothetical protein